MPPLAYLITFRTYATWLPGDARGFVTRDCREYGTPLREPVARLEDGMARLQTVPSVELDAARRGAVDSAIRDHCAYRNWRLHALNVRTNHVHSVLAASGTPERVMNELKSWSTRRMVERGLIERGRKAWARHGSTRYLWTMETVEAACRYVLQGQGEPLALELR